MYQAYSDEALVKRLTAEQYQTFVAMPFSDHGFYRSKEVRELITSSLTAIDSIPGRSADNPSLAKPTRIDDTGDFAYTITDSIVEMILSTNFFIADVTGNNAGVLLELGIALAARKGSESILVLTQGEFDELHFDIRNLKVVQYTETNLKEKLQAAMNVMIQREDENRRKLLVSIKKNLPANCIICLAAYCALHEHEDHSKQQQSLFFENSDFCPLDKRELPPLAKIEKERDRFPNDDNARLYFDLACDTLVRHHLLVCAHTTNLLEDSETLTFGYHATELGWLVMRETNKNIYEKGYDNWSKHTKPALKDKGIL